MTATPTRASDEISARLSRIGVPLRFTDCRLLTFVERPGTKRAIAAARRLASLEEGPADRGLVLMGPAGTGKTHLAVGILAARLKQWLSDFPDAIVETPERVEVRPPLDLAFVVVPTLLDRLRAGVAYEDVEDPLPRLMSAHLLVLDDLGREKSTDWVLERLYVLVNERYNRCLPTIVTSNYSPATLAQRGYDALVSRLVESSEVVEIEATDYRAGGRS